MKPGQIIKKFKSKKGKEIILRNLKKDDAQKLMCMINSVIAENDYILMLDKVTLKQEKGIVEKWFGKIRKKEMVILVAEHKNKIIGNSQITIGKGARAHVGNFGITLVNGFREEGIGSVLMKETLYLAKKLLKVSLITLEVYVTNKRAQSLYTKTGFKKVGLMPKAIKRKGKYISEIIMYKEL